MTGMFPNGGVAPSSTQNAITPEVTDVTLCPALFHQMRCNPRFDPAAANAVISELLEAINLKRPYDCTRLDNLKLALQDLTNFCALPVDTTVADTDSLAGCFDNTNKRATIAQLKLVFGICALTEATEVDLDDMLGMCIDGNNRRVSVANFIEFIKTQMGGSFTGYSAGGVFHSNSNNGSVDVGARNAFFVIPGWNAAPVQPGGLNAQWDVCGITLRRGRRGEEDNQDYQPITGPLLFVRSSDNFWTHVQPGGNWIKSSVTSSVVPYSGIDNGDTGIIQFLNAANMSALAT